MRLFEKHIRHILKFEGGYVNDPDDLGGETNYGIAKRFYPDIDIKNLKVNDAIKIYYMDYWIPAKCNDLPLFLQLIHFDTAVNTGIKRAAKILQKSIGTVEVDGIIGAKTIQASSTISLADYSVERCLYYAKIVRHRKKQSKFIVGWIARVRRVIKLQDENS